MSKQELLGEVKKLISMGKEKGFLTYDELNSTLPAEVVSSEQFGSIMTSPTGRAASSPMATSSASNSPSRSPTIRASC